MVAVGIDFAKLRGTEFQKDVWRALCKIPYGKVVSYKQLAMMSGHSRSVRAVANAVGKNPMPPIIPCHRVIRNDGTLGGYSGAGGIVLKKKLLAAEGVKI